MAAQKPTISYRPTAWKDDRAGGTPITAEQLNRIERGVADAAAGVNALNRLPMTYLVASDGEHATQDEGGTAIAAPCYVYDKGAGRTWFDAGDGSGRVAPFATAEEVAALRRHDHREFEGGWEVDRRGGVVTISGGGNLSVDAWQDKTVFTLPEGFRPPVEVFGHVIFGGGQGWGGHVCLLDVMPDGGVRLRGIGEGPINDWAFVTCTFVAA